MQVKMIERYCIPSHVEDIDFLGVDHLGFPVSNSSLGLKNKGGSSYKN